MNSTKNIVSARGGEGASNSTTPTLTILADSFHPARRLFVSPHLEVTVLSCVSPLLSLQRINQPFACAGPTGRRLPSRGRPGTDREWIARVGR